MTHPELLESCRRGPPLGNRNSGKWTPEHDAELHRLFDADWSHAKIAAEISAKFNVNYTRNAIIGRCHRLGLNEAQRPNPKIGGFNARKRSGIAARMHKPRPPQIKPAPAPVPRCEEIVPRNLTLLDLGPHDCRWPYGDRTFTFCGHPQIYWPYCASHQRASVGPGTASERAAV